MNDQTKIIIEQQNQSLPEKAAANTPSVTPLNVTPANKDYSPGFGDNSDAFHWTIIFGHILNDGDTLRMNYEDALSMIQRLCNLTNGVHQIPYLLGEDVGRFGTAPGLIADDLYPLGDGSAGSGYTRYKRFVNDSFAYNADIAQIVEPMLAGSERDRYIDEAKSIPDEMKDEYKIPEACYSHNADDEKTTGWGNAQNYAWYNLSLTNMYKNGTAQKAWEHMIDSWGFRTHIYYDALAPYYYAVENLTEHDGSAITSKSDELDTCVKESDYTWNKYAISCGHEVILDIYKNHCCYFTAAQQESVNNEKFLDFWKNSVMFSSRVHSGNDHDEEMLKNLVWGSEIGDTENGFGVSGTEFHEDFIKRFFKYNAPYLYMLEQTPLSYVNNDKKYSVTFSNGLVSEYNRETLNYTLTQGELVIADGNDRFVPQVGAGCKIYAYSENGGKINRILPQTWEGINDIDIYKLSFDSAPEFTETVSVSDGSITLDLAAGQPYLIVPSGNYPTPDTLMFNDLSDGDAVNEYSGVSFGNIQSGFCVHKADALGGFGSPSIFLPDESSSASTVITLESGSILHSFKAGNLGGSGSITLYSSNPENRPVTMSLPATGQVFKLQTYWRYAETGDITVVMENIDKVSKILLDSVVFTRPSK